MSDNKTTTTPAQQQALLSEYYANYLPVELIYEWLRPSENALPRAHRELSLSMLKPSDGSEIYKRWVAMPESFEKFKLLLTKMRPIPHKFDIGGIYTKPIHSKDDIMMNRSSFYAKFREYVIDIDMNDYDSVRQCCVGKKVCKKCWRFIIIAVEIVDETLREDFGFKNILWVFSGRRGIHCWVSDIRAKQMSNETRAGITEYMNLKHYQNPNGRFETRVFNIIEKHWKSILEEQELFSTPLKLAVKPFIEEGLKKISKSSSSSSSSFEIWNQLRNVCESKDLDAYMIELCAPRLDLAVSKDLGHLLKSPFCVHHATNKICLPLSLSQIRSLDPETLPKVDEIFDDSNSSKFEIWEQSLNLFKDFVKENSAARQS